MKQLKLNKYLTVAIVLMTLLISACEDVVEVELPESETAIVIDAWINNLPQRQTIRITETLPYFQNDYQPGVNGAIVTVTDNQQNEYEFLPDDDPGVYSWQPSSEDEAFGEIGRSYQLRIELADQVFESNSTMSRVPAVDSITFRFEEGNDFFPDSYYGSVFATDFQGIGDTYWIKAWKNGEFLNKPGEINLAFDAGFTQGGSVDGITFIQPIRDGINAFDQDENDDFLSPYEPGDSVYIEIHSISLQAFDFLNQVIIQSDRPGGFGQLFAQPLSNVPSNIKRISGSAEQEVIGFFNVSAVSAAGKVLDPDDLPE